MRKRYRVPRFDIRMTGDQGRLEQFLNGLEGEVAAIIPNVTPVPASDVTFLPHRGEGERSIGLELGDAPGGLKTPRKKAQP